MKQAFFCHGCGKIALMENAPRGSALTIIRPVDTETLRCGDCDPNSPLDRYEFVIVDGAWILREKKSSANSPISVDGENDTA